MAAPAGASARRYIDPFEFMPLRGTWNDENWP
jgi:hypothetical protein